MREELVHEEELVREEPVQQLEKNREKRMEGDGPQTDSRVC